MKKIYTFFAIILLCMFSLNIVNPAPASAVTNYYVNDNSLVGDTYTSNVGNDGNPGTAAAPFLTINYAISQSSPGDTIYVDAGTYALTSPIVVNKQLTFRGRQAGVDARTRSGPESIVDAINLTGYISAFAVQPAANGSIIDGFTEQGASGDGNFGGGIWLQQGTDGTTIQNNIIQNNIVGIFLANNSAINQTKITKNLFQNNTNPGPSSGHHIYADEYTASTNLQNVLIKDNKFTNSSPVSSSYAMGMSNTGTTAFTNIKFQDNQVSNQGRGVYFFGTTSSTVSGNTFTNATSTAVGIYSGGISNASFSITGNTFTNCFRGILISKFSPIDAYSGTLFPTGNTFTGGTYHLVNASTVPTTTVINAVGNTYDGVLLDGSTSLPNIFTIADKVLDAVDATPYGKIILRAGNVYVTVNSFYVPAGTSTPLIQRGVNIALATETVHVNSGSYTEQVEIDKDLFLIGQGAGATNIIAPASVPKYFSTLVPFADHHPVIYAHDAASIVVRNLTVDGAGNGNANNRLVGVGYFQAGGDIRNLEVKAVRNNPIDGVQAGTGIFGYSNAGTARTLNVIKNNIYDFQKNGITMSGAVLTAKVDSNTVTGAGPVNFIAQNGIQHGRGAKGSITNNTIRKFYYTPATATSCGILTFNNSDTIRITANTVDSSQSSIYGENNKTIISSNVINAGSTGLEIVSGSDENTSTIAINNAITNCAISAYIYAAPTDVAGVTDAEIHENSITGSSVWAIQNDGSVATVNAECNWYGSEFETDITPQINGTVDYDPWLISGTDNDPGSKGFQPVPGACTGALPVELTSFNSTITQRNVTLAWTTSSELNNSGFEILRSKQNESWSKIGFVNGYGTVTTPNNYTYEDRNLTSGRYHYRLKQIDFNGNFQYYDLQNDIVIGIPVKYSLSQNFPNPFNPSTRIKFDIPLDGIVSLKIFDITGKEVKTLINEFKSAGYYTSEFDGSALASGAYFYKIESGNFVETKRMLLVK